MTELVAALHGARAAEKVQALFYRALAAEAAERGADADVERLNGLHADEQHHLSRLSARLLELGEALEPLESITQGAADYATWEEQARERENAEVARYESLLAISMDDATRELVEGILHVERAHARELGGKWTPA